MRIEHLRTNHLENPVGYLMPSISLSWIVTEAAGNHAVKARVKVALDYEMRQIVHDSGEKKNISSVDYAPDLVPEPAARYFWQVQVWDDAGDCGESDVAYFETAAKLEQADWIKAPFDKKVQPIFRKRITVDSKPVKAMLYICGMGLYEAYINGKKIGDEYLTPYCNDYNFWQQYQTYDLTENIAAGENCLGVMLGNGWYKGRFGFVENMDELYGDTCHMICELHLTFDDGTVQIIPSDETWLCAPSPVMESSIYDGEIWDSRREIPGWSEAACDEKDFVPAVKYEERKDLLVPRLSLPVRIMEKIHPAEVIITAAQETVIDFGQEMTGWVEFLSDEPEGTQITFQFGEILQEDKFYNDNLRTAKQEYQYISNGKKTWVRPHFTFYGFRYMKVSGITDIDLDHFVGCVLYSDMEQTGSICTSNDKVNQLVHNALWGQKGNFLDVPTDCPQRDERMGWTGDAQVFCQTASFNMYTPAFYRKYMYDMKLEQDTLDGSVPHVVPDILGQINRILYGGDNEGDEALGKPHGSCAWSDAGAVIPWTVYQSFGDKTLLKEQYENMKAWVDYVRKIDVEKCQGSYLWTDGFHFADWLALDNYHKDTCFGATDPYFVASAYYYYSTFLTAKAARALGKTEDETYYLDLASHIKEAFLNEYYTPTGRLAQETQTALSIVLWLNLIPEGARQRQIDTLIKKLKEENMHLTTGVVGTPILCPALTENGHADAAYTLLLNEDYPSWLYEVNMGATTVWERWNSVLPDGSISDTGMNSLNHYAYGSIVEWMYRYMCGLNTCEEHPGFSRFVIRPFPDERFTQVAMTYDSVKGRIRSAWEKSGEGYLYTVEIPFDTEADFVLTSDAAVVTVNDEKQAVSRKGDRIHLIKGVYHIYVE